MKSQLHFETRAQGKLLLTGEYVVLDGATALAIPVRFGQTLSVTSGMVKGQLDWQSKHPDGTAWFEARFSLPDLMAEQTTDVNIAQTLAGMLRACQAQNPSLFGVNQSFKVITQNDFPREWGLGTSSTLIAALAKWLNLDPYRLLAETLGGSGYDIACAYADGPILYQLKDGSPQLTQLSQEIPFTQNLYFVYLGKKQDSREGIARYREQVAAHPEWLDRISKLTHQFLQADTLEDLEMVMLEHELLIAQALALPRAKDLYFSDYWGEVKSLGAWGGDFVMVSSARPEAETRQYFIKKGFGTALSWMEMTIKDR